MADFLALARSELVGAETIAAVFSITAFFEARVAYFAAERVRKFYEDCKTAIVPGEWGCLIK